MSMGAFFVYILKSSVCLSVFYLFYRLLLSRETFHRFNRIAVLGILLFSLLIPICEITVEQETDVYQTMWSLEQLLLLADTTLQTVEEEVLNTRTVWIEILLFVYFLGVLFFLCRNVYSFIRMVWLLKSGTREKIENGINLIIHNKDKLSPFSWMRYIVISQKDLEDSGREILIHEMAHIRNRHSIDLLITDICIFFQWFNPAAWLLKQELQNIHEYEADEAVISEGVNAKQYQLLLIKKAVGTRLYSMANSFNHSKLKKRITMMLKRKSNPWARLKYLYVLPLAAVTLTAFARPEVSNELKEISEFKVNDLTTNPVTDEGKNRLLGVTIGAGEGEMVLLEGGMERIGEGAWRNTTSVTMTYNSGKEEVQKEEKKETSYLAVRYNRGATMAYNTSPEPVFDEEAVRQSADSARSQYSVEVRNVARNRKHVVDTVSLNQAGPLIIIDGKEVTQATLEAINPHHIEVISVLKDAAATKEYGEKGANGVVIVTLTPKDKQDGDNIVDKLGIRVVGHKDE